jgi:hypothetical protein
VRFVIFIQQGMIIVAAALKTILENVGGQKLNGLFDFKRWEINS